MELAEFERANERAREMQASVPRAVAARYDRRLGGRPKKKVRAA